MLDTLARGIDRTLSIIGRVVALGVLAMIALITAEMFSRGVLGISLPWVQDLCAWLLTALIMLGGPYALLRGQFVRVDIVFARLSVKGKAIVDSLFTTVLLAIFIWVLVVKGGDFFLSSFAMDERSATGSWNGPVWVAKFMVPFGGALLGFAWFAYLVRIWREVNQPVEAVDDSGSPSVGM